MSGITSPNTETTPPESVGVPTPEVSQQVEAPLTAEEIQSAEQEIAELERIRGEYERLRNQPQQPSFDPRSFAEALKGVMPQPPQPTKFYDTEDWIKADFKTFRNGLGDLIQDMLQKFEQEKFNPLNEKYNSIGKILPQLYMRQQENPQFNAIQKRANEIKQKWPHIDDYTTYEMAREQVGQVVQKATPQVPPHMSAPDTRAAPMPVIDKGPANFESIVRDLRARHGNNI